MKMAKDGPSTHGGDEDRRSVSEGSDNNTAGASTDNHTAQQHASVEDSQYPTNVPLFNQLPRKVIELILYAVDANSFASLTLLNREWRQASESPLLYAHHLSRCPSFSLTTDLIAAPVGYNDLASLKRKFLKEIRRNAFDVLLRPRRTLLKLISTSMSSSTAFPQGEAFHFAFSANGRRLLCLSSSRIVVLDTTLDTAVVTHELQTVRRPLGAAILDDGSLVAVISSKHQVNIYNLTDDDAKHTQTIPLNDVPGTLALSPTGSVLALASDDGIEVYALGEGALVTERRAVRCSGVDSLSFSSDGSMLLGSCSGDQQRSIVTITAPFMTESGLESPQELEVRMWTTQIMFPDVINGYSHACLLPPHPDREDNWVLGYDPNISAFKAVNVNNAKTGGTYFATPLSSSDNNFEALPITVPTTDPRGELFALGFQGRGLWLYGVPDRLDLAPIGNPVVGVPDLSVTSPTNAHSPIVCPKDNSPHLRLILSQPKTVISGHEITDMEGITAARWVQVNHSTHDDGEQRRPLRLIAAAPGGVSPPTFGEEDVPIDGGRVLLLDFDRTTRDGEMTEMSIEIGEAEPKILREPSPSMDTEVELERRRTRLQRGDTASQRLNRRPWLERNATVAGVSRSAVNPDSPKARSVLRRANSVLSGASNDIDAGDTLNVPDLPYDNTQPRSQDTLHRAATAAATTRGRYNPRYRNPSHFERHLPHESDADNWVPPPPPYSRNPEVPLPEHLQLSLLPRIMEPVPQRGNLRRSYTTRLETMTQGAMARSQTVIQRLNTITSPRRGNRLRRTSSASLPSRHISEPRHTDATEPPQPFPSQDNEPSISIPSPTLNAPDAESRPSSPSSPDGSIRPAEDSPPIGPESEQAEDYPTVNDLVEWDFAVSLNPANLTARNYHSFSFSSPNLHIPVLPSDGLPDRSPQDTYPRAAHDVQTLTPANRQVEDASRIMPLGRRVSTDPTSTTFPPSAANQEWRQRIEAWNEQTIHERNKRNRMKCVVM